MDLERRDPRTRKFITNVGLITSKNTYGDNVMAAEWAHHVSCSPSLMAVNVHREDATHENILKSKEFGINLCSVTQNVISSISGNSSGRDVDKIKVLKELGVEFYKGNKINALMVKGAAMNAECKLHKILELGDHTMFVGEVVEISTDPTIEPLAYRDGKYWKLGERIMKPEQEVLDKISKLIEEYKK